MAVDPAAPVAPVMRAKKTWAPTKKWYAALAGSAASVAASWIVTGEFDDVERGMCATALVALVGAYFKSNDSTLTGDGVPAKVENDA